MTSRSAIGAEAEAATTDERAAPHARTGLGLAGALRTEVNRLAYHLRTPATRSGVTPTRLATLGALARYPQGVRQGDLAALMGMSAPSMTRLAEVLMEAGWVERERDATDARAYVLGLTAEGERTLANVRDAGTRQLLDDMGLLTGAERAALASAVPVLRKLADYRLMDMMSSQEGSAND
ncbi:MAG: MarR family transcriptional regulator [Nostocoides sp.]